MENTYQLVTDGSCDLPPSLVKEKKLIVVPFYVSFDGVNYRKEMEEVDVPSFYQEMVDKPKVFPKTSLPSVEDYQKVFEPLILANIPVICICITTKFSGSMQSALTARNILFESYPNAKITIIDATVNTVLQGLLVLEAVKMQEAGYTFSKLVSRLDDIKTTGRIFFTVGNIDYLKHGGRIGKLSGLAGSVLGIKPLITLKEGEIFPSGITRNRGKSMEKVIQLLEEYLKECKRPLTDYSLAVGYGYDISEANLFRDMVLTKLNAAGLKDALPIYQIGATIGVHTGPYPLGLGIIQKYDSKS